MFQQLLIERFKLVHRLETKQMPIYALTMVKPGVLGERLRRNSIDCASLETPVATRRDPKQCGLRFGSSTIDSQGRTLNYLTESITSHVGRLIVDRTGLTGAFDFSIQWNRAGTVRPLALRSPARATWLEARVDDWSCRDSDNSEGRAPNTGLMHCRKVILRVRPSFPNQIRDGDREPVAPGNRQQQR